MANQSNEPENGDGGDGIKSVHQEVGPKNINPKLIAPKHSL